VTNVSINVLTESLAKIALMLAHARTVRLVIRKLDVAIASRDGLVLNVPNGNALKINTEKIAVKLVNVMLKTLNRAILMTENVIANRVGQLQLAVTLAAS
jgi:hypothetical protein